VAAVTYRGPANKRVRDIVTANWPAARAILDQWDPAKMPAEAAKRYAQLSVAELLSRGAQ